MAKAKKRPTEIFIVEGTFWYNDENEHHSFTLPLWAYDFADANTRAEAITDGFGAGVVEISSVRKPQTL